MEISGPLQERPQSHPRSDSDHILRAITPDLVKGASAGWPCHAPDGSKLLVFADVSIFVGDDLQVTKTSMLMGHGAKSPCPLCAYRVLVCLGVGSVMLAAARTLEWLGPPHHSQNMFRCQRSSSACCVRRPVQSCPAYGNPRAFI